MDVVPDLYETVDDHADCNKRERKELISMLGPHEYWKLGEGTIENLLDWKGESSSYCSEEIRKAVFAKWLARKKEVSSSNRFIGSSRCYLFILHADYLHSFHFFLKLHSVTKS